MIDDKDDAARPPQYNRRETDRRRPNNDGGEYREEDDWLRTPRPTVITVFDKLGYDARNPDSVRDLRDLLKFIAEKKDREEWWRNRRIGWLVLLATTIAGSIFGPIANWFLSRK